MLRPRFAWLVAMLLVTAGLVAVVAAQAPRSTQPSSQDELLAEVRGLRAELNQAAGASMRMQLLVARLQLQEQRIFSAGRQVSDVQTQLATVRQEIIGLETILKVMPQAPSQTQKEEPNPLNPFVNFRAQIAEKKNREQQLLVQEAELLSTLATEQGRWTGFNDQLDALERSLPRAVPR
jgi:hypothetical protein